MIDLWNNYTALALVLIGIGLALISIIIGGLYDR